MENRWARQGTNLQDRLKLEKSKLSYADLHCKVIENADNIPSTSGNQQKLRAERKATENEELVKYMSNLPSYLERNENLWKKAFNVGVLDWRSLEKWQYNHKGIPYRSSRDSLSSSNASSFFSTEGSSTHSSRGPSCSPARQRIHRPTLQSLLIASPKEGYSQGVKSFGGSVGNSQDLKAASREPLKGHQRMLRTYQSFEKESKRKDSYPHIVPDIKVRQGFENYSGELHSKGKMKIQEGESRKRVEKMQEPYHYFVDHDLTAINYQRSSEANQRRFSDVLSSEEVYSAELYSDIPHSCPLPCEVDKIKCSHLNQSRSLDKKSVKFSAEQSKSSPSSAKISINPSRGKKSSKHLKPSEGSDLKMGTVATQVRNSSPTRRFSIDMGKARSASYKDGSVLLQLSSKHVTAKSGSEKSVPPDCLDNTSSDKPNSTSRARSSPLRRLLEPLLKPKAANSHHFSEPLRKDSSSTYGACKSSNGRVESSILHPVKVKLDFTSSRTTSANDSHHREKHGLSTVQALLKIAIKNGLPVFTFAIGKNVDILAATMKKIQPSEKDDNSCIYTFFKICEVKNKNGRINQRSKGKGPGYVPNVVAQMKVSNSQFLESIRHNPVDQFSIREFVLFAVDLNHVNRHTSDLQPNDELAAIVVKFPKEPPSGLIQDGHRCDNFNHISVTGLKEPLPEVTSYSNFKDNKENGSSVGSQDLFNMTVILPVGIHGLPSKGEPSPLIERWISGGACDCGGWDLGCRIRVLATQTQLRRSSSSKAHPTAGRFEIFPQGEVLHDRPPFSLSRLVDGVFSVEFNSSLSLLQAFSICIAVLNSRKPYELSESSDLFEEKSSKETTLPEHYEIKAPSGNQVEVAARYASYPPLSPVGRV
ncbi:uncharacterized protein LOC132269385 [Cornus florida]|uniref:uncharacterized protein LOC132269385 n=1 Tax=Cornus florida TaxID=4283 RepID=UPI002898B837|nr:uncharacterized protein LOC132269385 [Cornus florida]